MRRDCSWHSWRCFKRKTLLIVISNKPMISCELRVQAISQGEMQLYCTESRSAFRAAQHWKCKIGTPSFPRHSKSLAASKVAPPPDRQALQARPASNPSASIPPKALNRTQFVTLARCAKPPHHRRLDCNYALQWMGWKKLPPFSRKLALH